MRILNGRVFSLATLTVVSFFVSTAQGVDLQSQVDPLAKPLVEDGDAVGFVVGILKDGQTQVLAYGETSKDSGTAPNGDTVYEIGSVSKVFTSLLLADMVDSGKVKLDDPVQKYLPDSVKMPVKDDQPITLAHLATHTSGLPRMPDNFAPADSANPYADYTVEKLYAFLNGHPLRRPPGEYEYSNVGAALLGHVLALHEGASYEQLLIDCISKPLGMEDSRIALSEEQKKRLAPPYNAALEPDKGWDQPVFVGAGGIRSTVNDLLKFAAANLKDDSTSLTRAMHLALEKRAAPKGGQAMGLAWHIAPDGRTRLHSGMTGGYSAWLAINPDQKLGVVVLANTASEKISRLGEAVTRLALGLKVELHAQRKTIQVAPAVLATYAGTYALAPEFAITITVENGRLMAQATGQGKYPVFAESPTKFFYKVVDAQLDFEPDENGKVDKLILHQNGKDLPGTRKD